MGVAGLRGKEVGQGKYGENRGDRIRDGFG